MSSSWSSASAGTARTIAATSTGARAWSIPGCPHSLRRALPGLGGSCRPEAQAGQGARRLGLSGLPALTSVALSGTIDHRALARRMADPSLLVGGDGLEPPTLSV